MELYVQTGEGDTRVELREHADGHATVVVDGREIEIDAQRIGDLWSLIIDGEQREVVVMKTEVSGFGSTYQVQAEGRETEVRVLDPLSYRAQLAEASRGVRGEQQVKAYMPGRVVSILVEVGEQVEPGMGVLVLEAMKMENEIAAETSGVLTEIFVEEGQAVDGGDPLFIVR